MAPAVRAMRTYSLPKLRRDLVAGLTVSVVELPQAMAYALIAGVPPEYGLYTSIIQGTLNAFLSSSEHLATGPTNTQSLLVASAVARLTGSPGHYLQLVFALTAIKGVIQLLFAMARMGALVRYVSRSVIVGVAAGAAMLIILGQIPALLGVELPDGRQTLPGVLGLLERLAQELGSVNELALWIGLACIVLIGALRLISPFVPGALIAIVAAAAMVAAMGWGETKVPVVGPIKASIPSFNLPAVSVGDLETLLSAALALALLGMLETVAIAKTMAAHAGERVSANREFFAQGMNNLVSGFFQCIPGSGSFTRSALDYAAGGQTRFASLFNAGFVAVMFLGLGHYARHIPLSALAAVLLVIAAGMIDYRYFWRIARTDRAEATVCLVTASTAILLPFQYAIFIGIFLSIAMYVRKASRLHLAEMVPGPGGRFTERPLGGRSGDRKVLFLQLEGDLFFAIADELQEQFREVSASGPQVVILRLKRTHSMDVTVLEVLERFVRRMRERGRHVLLCGIRPELMKVLSNFELMEVIGRENLFETGPGIFSSAQRALSRARELTGASMDADGVDTDDEGEEMTYQI